MSLQRILCILIACLVLTQGAFAEWNETSPEFRPTEVRSGMFAYDDSRSYTWLYGGQYGGVNTKVSNALWVYNHTDNNWTNMTHNLGNWPLGIRRAGLTYDSEVDQLILYGGSFSDGTLSEETWIYNISANAWFNITHAPADYATYPVARNSLALLFLKSSNRTALIGGVNPATDNQTWIFKYSDNTWVNMTPAVTPDSISMRGGGDSATYNSDKGVIMTYINKNESWVYNYTSNLWYNITNWTNMPTTEGYVQMAYDTNNSATVIQGGHIGGADANETWVHYWSSNAWVNQTLTRPNPAPLQYGGTTFDNLTNRTFVFCGLDELGRSNRSWAFELGASVAPIADSITTNVSATIFDPVDILISLNGSDGDGDTLTSYVVVFKNGVRFTTLMNDTSSPTTVNHTYHFLSAQISTNLTYVFMGIIDDGYVNSTNKPNATVVISPRHPYPQFTWAPSPSFMSDVITFNATTLNLYGSTNTTTWGWDWGDDFNATNDSGQMNTTHMYRWQPGTFNVVFNTTNYWNFTNATHRTITVSGIRVMAFFDATPDTNTSFNITISNSTDSYTEDLTGSGVFIWRNITDGIPTGSVTVKVSKTNYEDSVSYHTFNSVNYINLTAFLASSTDCVTQPFQVIDQNADPINAVTITINKTIGGISQTVTELSTDGTGYTSACLIPTDLHTFKAEKTGYSSLDWTSLNPSTTTRTIKLALIQEGGGFIGLNNTWYVLLFPPTPQFNVTRDQLTGVMNEPRCSAVWWEINITNETGTPYSWKTLTNPCYAINTIIVNTTTGLKDLPVGSKFTVSFFEYSNATEGNHTKNYTMISTGALSTASIQNFLEFVSVSFSQTTLSFLALILAMVIGGTVSRLVGFGGIFVIIICTMFATMGAFGWDVYLIAAIPALASYLGKRWT